MAVQQRYAEWPARRSPRGSVACLWASRPSETTAGLVLPDACIDVIWDGSSIFVAGPDTGPVPVPPHPGQCFAGLRFWPGKAPGFLGAPASELLDSRVSLGDLWGEAAAGRLAERLAGAHSAEEAAGLLDEAIADRARTAPGSDPIVDQLVGIFRKQPDAGGVVRHASHVLSVGERRLHRRCSASVGYGPKMLERVLRFQRARRIARDTGSLAAIAAMAGYADQAHLTREARRLAGRTPSDLFKTAPLAAS
ncbi:MAG: helix-turn-helix domain-containing protein [Streptosporangiaceae bacterium]